jgi:hypothetical protein
MKVQRERSGLRVVARWFSTALAAFIAVTAAGTLFVHATWLSPGGRYLCVVGAGAITLQEDFLPINGGPLGFWIGPNSRGSKGAWQWSFTFAGDRVSRRADIPLWAPFLLTVLPTGLLWRGTLRARRRESVGRCATCGYDLKGLATPTTPCPECGARPT